MGGLTWALTKLLNWARSDTYYNPRYIYSVLLIKNYSLTILNHIEKYTHYPKIFPCINNQVENISFKRMLAMYKFDTIIIIYYERLYGTKGRFTLPLSRSIFLKLYKADLHLRTVMSKPVWTKKLTSECFISHGTV